MPTVVQGLGLFPRVLFWVYRYEASWSRNGDLHHPRNCLLTHAESQCQLRGLGVLARLAQFVDVNS